MKISYNWLSSYFTEKLPTNEELFDIFTFKLCEVEGIEKLEKDNILDLNILPNRAHDLLSHRGIARELGGMLGKKTKEEKIEHIEGEPTNLKIEIKNDTCRRYAGRIIRGVKIGPSPQWLKERLESVGQKSINNVVDATNFVMLDLGQPCHVFDADKITNYEIQIANAHQEQKIVVLGGGEVELKASDLLITDRENNPLAIAGVKGGIKAEVESTTVDIILEVANFDPVAVRKTARRLGLLTDSAKRFENDLSPSLVGEAMDVLTKIILDTAGGKAEVVVDNYVSPTQIKKIEFKVGWINKLLGTSLSEKDMVAMLTLYGYEIVGDTDTYILTVPPLRLDLTNAQDIAEEVSRLYGLDKIEAMPLSLSEKPKVNDIFLKTLAVRTKLVADGYKETITYAFRKKGVFEVARGVGDKGALRVNLVDGLKESYELNRLNAPLLGMDSTGSPQVPEMKIFEIGTVWSKDGENIHVAYVNKKEAIEMTLDEYVKNYKLQITNYELLSHSNQFTQKFVQWSSYPFVTRDIAVWVPEGVESDELKNIYKEFGTDLLRGEPVLFDQFTKNGKTSYAFRLVFQSYERTLVDEEINTILERIVFDIHKRGWEVR